MTLYPSSKDRKEIEFLDKLYSLWTNVTQTIGGYVDVLWTEVRENIDVMTETVTSFRRSARSCPRLCETGPRTST